MSLLEHTYHFNLKFLQVIRTRTFLHVGFAINKFIMKSMMMRFIVTVVLTVIIGLNIVPMDFDVSQDQLICCYNLFGL